MKKAIYTLLMTATVVLSVIACQKKDEGNQASTPTVDCNIPGNTSCNPGLYHNYGFTQYGAYNGGQFCNCPMGTRPVMNLSWGLSCAPDNFFTSYSVNFQYGAYSYSSFNVNISMNSYNSGPYPQNLQWTAIPLNQIQPTTYVGGATSACYSYAATVCDLRLNQGVSGLNQQCTTNNGGFGTCHPSNPSGPASTLGICSTSGLNSGYNYGVSQPYGGGGYSGSGCLRYVGSQLVNVCSNSWGGGYNYGR